MGWAFLTFRRARVLEHVAAELGVPMADPLVAERHGRSFTVTYSRGGARTPPRLRITADVDETTGAPSSRVAASAYRDVERPVAGLRPAVVLKRETGYELFGERVGLGRGITTGDAQFDDLVRVDTSSREEDVRRTLGDERLRRAVRGLLLGGATTVELGPKGLSAVCDAADALALAAADLERFLDLLAEAAGALPLFQAG